MFKAGDVVVLKSAPTVPMTVRRQTAGSSHVDTIWFTTDGVLNEHTFRMDELDAYTNPKQFLGSARD